MPVNESNTIQYTVVTSRVPDGTTLYWKTTGNTTNSDIVGGNTGSITINNNRAVFNVALIADVDTDGTKTLGINLLTGSINGTSVTSTPTPIIVNDTSQAPVPYNVNYLLVAGGGGGGTAGGGGGGGYRTGTLAVYSGTPYTVTVGAGGAFNGDNGSNSVFGSATSIGGGAGGVPYGGTGSNGGSGGGGSGGGSNPGGAGGNGTPGQGNPGGVGGSGTFGGGGGGGAGAPGTGAAPSKAGNGGNGLYYPVAGTYFSGGGAGPAGSPTQPAGTPGLGGGAPASGPYPTNVGAINTGGGGTGFGPGAAGSGIVILSIPIASYPGSAPGASSSYPTGSEQILIYTSSSTYTA